MRTLLAILLACATSVMAQQPQRASDASINGSIQEIVAQRDIAQIRAIEHAGKLAEAAEREKADKAEIERLKKLCGKPCEPEAKK